MSRAWVGVFVFFLSPVATALPCPRLLANLTRDFRQKFNEGVLIRHQRESVQSFAAGFDATKHDLTWSARFHAAVVELDRAWPGWDTSPEVKMIATAHELPLIAKGVFPKIFPKHTLVLVRERDGVPVLAVTLSQNSAEPPGRFFNDPARFGTFLQ